MTSPASPSNDRVHFIERITGYNFHNPSLLHEALRTAGTTAFLQPRRLDGNKDLAQIGDAALRLTLISDGYKARACRSTINETLSARASNAPLAETGFKQGLDRLLYVNPSQGRLVSPKVMATAVEAILGAVYIDSGEDTLVLRSVMAALDLDWRAKD
ncbi:ribonuclease III domain-containing protein [Aspergillus leporis]|uniref:Ribonuclease III domain-containing protein n=1 Tax=Aspergillus leporis TaxID=41062 RepID=A0A5N5XCH9_9EURO|nr:ribonuclease III domain-containing protein [Aspergillus leporis]